MNVGLLGYGVVASATMKHFLENRTLIESKISSNIEFLRIGTRTVSKIGKTPNKCKVTSDCWSVVNDPSIDVIIELIGGTEISKDLVLQAISNKKHVITANKCLLAKYGDLIFKSAEEHGVCILFEGAVAVSIPIVKTLKDSVAANNISSVVGILNGTSNYILTQMSERGVSFNHALTEAKEKGYAEANPILDINGEDAAHKITLLSSLSFGIPIDFSYTIFEGIQNVSKKDISVANSLGFKLKLIAESYVYRNKVCTSVSLTFVCNSHVISNVNNSMNGILIKGDLFDTIFQYGPGAGGKQTASAILSDLIELSRYRSNNKIYNLGFVSDKLSIKEYLPESEKYNKFYFRIKAGNDHVLEKVFSTFNNHSIDISKKYNNCVFITDKVLVSKIVKLTDSLIKLSINFVKYPLLENE